MSPYSSEATAQDFCDLAQQNLSKESFDPHFFFTAEK